MPVHSDNIETTPTSLHTVHGYRVISTGWIPHRWRSHNYWIPRWITVILHDDDDDDDDDDDRDEE